MEAIYAIDMNGGLSKDCIIPWHSKKDMKFFVDKTKYNVVIMGKNTYLSLPKNVRPLKNRLNIVLTKNLKVLYEQFNYFKEATSSEVIFTENCDIYSTILNNREKYIKMCPYLNKEFKIYIIGGKSIYEQFIPLCHKVWITKLKKSYNCDLCLKYDYSKQFKEPEIIYDDAELTIYKYEKKLN